MWLQEAFFIWVGRQTLLELNWLHDKNNLHGYLKPANILAFTGPHSPHIKIGGLGSCVDLSSFGVDDNARIKRCITTHEYAAHELLMAGITRGCDKQTIALALSAYLYAWGVMMLELIGTQHPLHPIIKSPIGEPNRPRS